MRVTPGYQAIRARNEFAADLLPILGDTRLLWIPNIGETTTAVDLSLTGRTLTHLVSQAARLNGQGLGYTTIFDGTNDYMTTPDTANLSFGNATADVAFSIIVLGNQTANAASKTIAAKYGGTTREWLLLLDANEKLQMSLFDESVDITASRITDAAVTVGSLAFWGMVYSAATGGATAADDITFYQNGQVVASTATNNALYLAMEDQAQQVTIGATSSGGSKFVGSMSGLAICQKALSANEMQALYQRYLWFYGFV